MNTNYLRMKRIFSVNILAIVIDYMPHNNFDDRRKRYENGYPTYEGWQPATVFHDLKRGGNPVGFQQRTHRADSK